MPADPKLPRNSAINRPAGRYTRLMALVVAAGVLNAFPAAAQVELPQVEMQPAVLQVSPVGTLLLTTNEVVRAPVETTRTVSVPVKEIRSVDGREETVTKYVSEERSITLIKEVLRPKTREILPNECSLQWVTGKAVRSKDLRVTRVAHPVVVFVVPSLETPLELDPFYRRVLNPDTLVVAVAESQATSVGGADGRLIGLKKVQQTLTELPGIIQAAQILPELEITNSNAAECRVTRIEGRGRPLVYHSLQSGQTVVLRSPVGTRWRAEFGSATKPIDLVMPAVPCLNWSLDSDSELEVDLGRARTIVAAALKRAAPAEQAPLNAVLTQIAGEFGPAAAAEPQMAEAPEAAGPIVQVGADGEVEIRLVNRSGRSLAVFYDAGDTGEGEEYFALDPGGSEVIVSFVGHRWYAKAGDKLVAEFRVPQQGGATWSIEPPVQFAIWNAGERGLFKQDDGGSWLHFGPDGQLVGRFEEKQRTDEFVAIYEHDAKTWVRLYEDRALIDTPVTDGWQDFAERVGGGSK